MVVRNSNPTVIRAAAESEAAACFETLTRAFELDAVCRWAWPETERFRRAFPRFCRAFGGAAFNAGTAHVDDDIAGVALWLPPGTAADDEAVGALIEQTTPAHLRGPLQDIFIQMEAFHPRATHWHLPLIGVDRRMQGRGLGSALLRKALKICDETRTLAYLEATGQDNVRLYERHGFRAVGVIQAADSPVITPMARTPATVTD